MNLQPASRREVTRIAIGTAVCAAIMVAVFALLGAAGVYPFRYTVIVGAAGGSIVAVVNFALMCLTVQKVAGMADKKRMQAQVQLSYNGRLMLQAVWAVLALVLPFIQPVAGLLPLLFPRVVIFFLQASGTYKKEAAAQAAAAKAAAQAEQSGDAAEQLKQAAPDTEPAEAPAPEPKPEAETEQDQPAQGATPPDEKLEQTPGKTPEQTQER